MSDKNITRTTRKVGLPLGVGIALVPIIFSFFLLRPGYSYLARTVAFSWLALVVYSALTENSEKKPDSTFSATKADPQEAPARFEEPVKAKEATIRDGAIFKIDKKGSPRTFKNWGGPSVDRINALFEPGGKIIAQSPECAEIVTIALSDERSDPNKKEIVLFVDCVDSKNENTRFYITESEIKSGTLPPSEKSLAAKIQTRSYISDCYTQLKNRTAFPSTFDAHALGTQASVSHLDSKRIEIVISFKAKNSFGAMLPYSGRCNYNGKSLAEIEISPR